MAEVTIHPEAEAEYEYALGWYLERSLQAADGFEAAFNEAIGRGGWGGVFDALVWGCRGVEDSAPATLTRHTQQIGKLFPARSLGGAGGGREWLTSTGKPMFVDGVRVRGTSRCRSRRGSSTFSGCHSRTRGVPRMLGSDAIPRASAWSLGAFTSPPSHAPARTAGPGSWSIRTRRNSAASSTGRFCQPKVRNTRSCGLIPIRFR